MSRVSPGVKQVISRNGLKKQKQVLTDALHNLHRKFVSGGGRMSSSVLPKTSFFGCPSAIKRQRNMPLHATWECSVPGKSIEHCWPGKLHKLRFPCHTVYVLCRQWEVCLWWLYQLLQTTVTFWERDWWHGILTFSSRTAWRKLQVPCLFRVHSQSNSSTHCQNQQNQALS